MKKRRKNRGQPAALTEQQMYQASAAHLMALSGFDGANRSSRRGWIYWPTLDTKRELDSYSRTELLKKSRWLRANFGIANRICSGLSDMIGYLTPLSISGDEQWDLKCDAHWEERACEAMVVDASGTFDIRGIQIELNKAAIGDGDILPMLIKGSTDGVMLALYEAHQLGSPLTAGNDWVDGVRVNKFRRHLGYGIREDNGEVRTVNARDCLYYAHPDATGRIRPPTMLKHGINHLQDISEILSDVKLTIKVAAQLGLYIKNAAGNSGGFDGPRAVAGNLRNEQLNGGTNPNTDPTVEYKVEDFYKSLGGLMNLPGGAEIGTIQDERPHPSQISLIDYLVRDIAWGVGVAPEILWNIEKLRGANNRLVNADLDRWIAVRLLRQRAWLKRFRAIWVANEIEAGRLEEPPGSAKFWRATFLPQESLTADKGRIGKLNIELVKTGLRSLATHYGEEGRDWQTELRQIARERKFLKGLDLVFADLDRAGAPPAGAEKDDPDEDEQEEDLADDEEEKARAA